MPDAFSTSPSPQTHLDVGAPLRAIDRQVATVNTATADLVAATVAEPIALPTQGGGSTTYRDLTLSLRRHEGGTYTSALGGAEGETAPTTLFKRTDPHAAPRRPRYRALLGPATAPVPELRIGPGAGAGHICVEAYTAPYLGQLDPGLRPGPGPDRHAPVDGAPRSPRRAAREQSIVADIASRTRRRGNRGSRSPPGAA